MRGNFYDILNFISKLDKKRFMNIYDVYTSYRKSVRKGKSYHAGMPVALSIEPTTSCNLRCPECISGLRDFTRPTGNLDFNLYKNVIDDLKDFLVYLILYFQGEPYLHPNFFEMVEYASKRGIYTATSTNAHYLNSENALKTVRSGLDRLIISMDGVSQESYETYRIGGNLEKVKTGIKNLVEAKDQLKLKTPFIILQFIAFKHNEDEIEDIKQFGKEIGVDTVAIKTAQINDPDKNAHLIPSNHKLSRYDSSGKSKWNIKNLMKNECWKMWHSSVITWDGQVVPCCFDKDADHSIGNIENGTQFSDIWRSKNYDQFRDQILNSRSSIDMCKNCTEGSKVWA